MIGVWLLIRAFWRPHVGHCEGNLVGMAAGLVPCPLTLFMMTYAVLLDVPYRLLSFAVVPSAPRRRRQLSELRRLWRSLLLFLVHAVNQVPELLLCRFRHRRHHASLRGKASGWNCLFVPFSDHAR